jgi:hypothetical protein
MSRVLWIIFGAIMVPLTVMAVVPPPADLSTFTSILFLVWLAFIGGLAGYGLDSI